MAEHGTQQRTISGRYALKGPLGKGGMGVVWRAGDTLLQRDVAVKEIEIPHGIPSSEAEAIKARALREARSAARLSHPGVVTIYDVVQEDGHAYIVMELVEAPTLADAVGATGPLDPKQAAAIGLELLDALEAAHANGIVHRDVKPANVMLVDNRSAKLADFGIAAVKGDPKITSTGMVLGSPQFMAPEQAVGVETGPATDLWGLGATLYWAVEGDHPFDRNGPIPTLAAVVHDDPRPMQRAGVLAPAIDALLSKSSTDRPSGPELRRMLQSAVGGEVPVDTRRAPVPVPHDDPAPVVQPTPRAAPPRARRSGRALIAALVILLIAGIAAALIARSPEDAGTRQAGEEARGEGGQGAGEGDAEEQSNDESDDGEVSASVPEGWTSYEDPNAGWRIAHPEEWTVEPQNESMIDFRDPSSGTYLRVDWTDAPGDDAVAAWEAQSADFGARHENYEEISITRTTYREYEEAALWEYTYSEGGADLHAYNLGFVVDDEWGFALNFQTDEEDWESSQELFDQFMATWQPPD